MSTVSHPALVYPIRSVPLTRPFVWLACAWDDLIHHRTSSLLYGVIVCSLGALILVFERHPFYIAAAISGFLLVGPILAAGLCELSRCSDANLPTDFDSSLKSLRRNHDSLLGVANRLLLISVCWFVFSYLLLQATIGTVAPGIDQTVWGDVLRHLTEQQIVAYLVCGGVLAGLVFALSVVTVPMIVDRHVDARTAILTSLRVTVKDFPVMLVWGSLIAVLVAIGFATFLIGMVVIFPLLGHATWYAYRDLVKH
jgi:uncharacterized membrane protein